MSQRNKLLLVATGLLLLALATVLLRPLEWHPSTEPSATKAGRSRPASPPPMTSAASREPRRAKNFQAFVKLAEKGELPELSRQEIDDYLSAQHRTAGSLLAA